MGSSILCGPVFKKPPKKQKWQVCVWFKRTTNVVRLWENNICTFQTICFACMNACYRETERNGGKSLFLFCSEVYLISLEGFTGQNLGSERFAIWSLYVVTAVSLYGHNSPPPHTHTFLYVSSKTGMIHSCNICSACKMSGINFGWQSSTKMEQVSLKQLWTECCLCNSGLYLYFLSPATIRIS